MLNFFLLSIESLSFACIGLRERANKAVDGIDQQPYIRMKHQPYRMKKEA
jgi:hypothetical protein